MNSMKIAAALRVLANAIEAPEDDAPGAAPTQPAAEPTKRGRGRPAKGEESAPAAAAASATASAVTAVTAPGAGAAATSPSEDPFATPPAAPTATLDEVRASLKALAAAIDQATALNVLKSAGGAANLTDLKPENYGTVVYAAEKALPAVKTEPVVEADPFEMPAGTPAAEVKPVTLEDVKALLVATQKRTSQDTVQKVVMKHGGKTALSTGGEGPSLKALPESAYAAVIAELKALPATK